MMGWSSAAHELGAPLGCAHSFRNLASSFRPREVTPVFDALEERSASYPVERPDHWMVAVDGVDGIAGAADASRNS